MNSFKKILKNESGVALMMVITAIVLLTTIMTEFSFESNINKLKAYNIQDRAQARLNAEAGLNFAMTRLKLYQEAYNILQNNESAKSMIKQEVLNFIWNFPFAYPVPVTEDMNGTVKEMIKDFEENSVIQGQMLLTIQNISQKINLNLLRVSSFMDQKEFASQNEEEKEPTEFNIVKQIQRTFELTMEEKRETDIDFYNRYAGTNWEELIKILAQYVSDQRHNDYVSTLQDDDGYTLEPKYAPYTLWSELYMMPRWTDELIDIMKNEYTTQGAVYIDLNKITANMLKLLIPNINDEEIKNFFEFRDDPENPQFFNNVSDFKNYIVNKANIITQAQFEERFNKYKEEGIEFGVAPTLFKIISTGIKSRAKFNLEAYVSMPIEPVSIRSANANPVNPENPGENEGENENEGEGENTGTGGTGGENTGEQKPQLLLAPRVIEIFVN